MSQWSRWWRYSNRNLGLICYDGNFLHSEAQKKNFMFELSVIMLFCAKFVTKISFLLHHLVISCSQWETAFERSSLLGKMGSLSEKESILTWLEFLLCCWHRSDRPAAALTRWSGYLVTEADSELVERHGMRTVGPEEHLQLDGLVHVETGSLELGLTLD